MDAFKQQHKDVQGALHQRRCCHSGLWNIKHRLFGLLSLLCVFTLGLSSASATKNPSSSMPSNTSSRNFEDVNVPLEVSECILGTQGRLPCNVTPPIINDKVILVIWYKDGLSTPIYSFDVREAQFEKGSHWVDETKFNRRAYFQANAYPSPTLVISNTTDADNGQYRCRVDFHKSPTRNTRVQLRVVVPPEKVLMLDEKGVHIPNYILGPYNEGSSINLTCVSIGGSPLPNITWSDGETVLKGDVVYLSEKRVKNVLHLDRLQRSHLHRVLTCHAANNNITQPISSSVTLDMNLRPLWVKLQGENRPLSEDKPYELQCQVAGSKPEPTITWWKGSQPMRNTKQMTNMEGNVTTSILSFTPTIDDRGKFLSCRADQSLIQDSGKEHGWKLDIYHKPVVTLEIGTNQNQQGGEGIREGADVYFECNIKSNPWIYRVSWKHNNKSLVSSPEEGISVANQSLVLQNITRSQAGSYTCVGSNREGNGESNSVQLEVQFAPVCRPGQASVYRAARQEDPKVVCELEANPPNVNFTWTFNGTESIDIPASDIYTDLTRSMVRYVPDSENDYGILLCWGTNELGQQAHPCVFHVLPAGPPDPVTNCSVANITFDMVSIECAAGFNGGLEQAFRAEVFTSDYRHHIKTVQSRSPSIEIHNLQSGVNYGIKMYAFNEKGDSKGVGIPIYTLKGPEKQTDLISLAPDIEDIRPFLPIIMGASAGIVLIGLMIVMFIRHQRRSKDTVNNTCANGGTPTSNRLSDAESDDSLEKNPDIIPQTLINSEQFCNDANRQYPWDNINGHHPSLYPASTPARLHDPRSVQYNQQPCTSTNYETQIPVSYSTAKSTEDGELMYAELGIQTMSYSAATLGRPTRNLNLT